MAMIAGLARAEVLYEYTGNTFGQVLFDDTPPEGSYDLKMGVHGHFIFADLLSDTSGELRPVGGRVSRSEKGRP